MEEPEIAGDDPHPADMVAQHSVIFDRIWQLIKSVEIAQVHRGVRGRDRLLVCADDISQMAMERLEEEFSNLLRACRLPTDPERLSFRSAEDSTAEDSSSGSFEASADGEITPAAEPEYVTVPMIEPSAITTLNSIAKLLCHGGYEQECFHAYITSRQDAIGEYTALLWPDKLSCQELQGMEWKTQNSLMKRWGRAMKAFVRVCLAGESRLRDLVFRGVAAPGTNKLLTEISSVQAMLILSFAEAVAIGPTKPEKLVLLLDMYQVMEDLLPDIQLLFPDDGYDRVILTDYRYALLQLKNSAKRTAAEFRAAIRSQSMSVPSAQGGVLPLAQYVMNYAITLTACKRTIDLIFETSNTLPESGGGHHPSEPPGGQQPLMLSATGLQLQSLVSALESTVEEKSLLHSSVPLRCIFLMNNIHYMVEKVKNSDLRDYLGDTWIRSRIKNFRQHAVAYERAAWSGVLSCMRDDGHGFREFNAAFEEVYRVQTGWHVPDQQLREELRISIAVKLIQAYRGFLGRCAGVGDGGKQRNRCVKYSPDDLENYLLDLFANSPKCL